MRLLAGKQFRAGDWVQVLEWEDIQKTLDADGTCDGLPFMPEMIEFCGRRYQVRRYAEKICVELPGGVFSERALNMKDIVILDELRCSGQNHDGCQRLCLILWSVAWIKKCQEACQVRAVSEDQEVVETNRLQVKVSPTKYFCQATQLMPISRPLFREGIFSQIRVDLRTGAIGVSQMVRLVLIPYFNKFRRKYWRWSDLGGTLTRTPVDYLNLRAGDLVEVKSLEEMRATLDTMGRNRGLQCDRDIARYCGKQFVVRGRLDRFISDATGEMRTLNSTVMLEGAPCPCSFSVGGCPRKEFTYFREIWLKRVDGRGCESRQKMEGVV